MALTNEEKNYLILEVKDYLQRRISKREATYALIQEGFKASTIDRYCFVLKVLMDDSRRFIVGAILRAIALFLLWFCMMVLAFNLFGGH